VVCGLAGYIDKYSKYISQRPLSEEMRGKGLAWSQDINLFWESVKNRTRDEEIGLNCGVAVFWIRGYPGTAHDDHYLSPWLQCDIGYVDLSLDSNNENAEGYTGSWLEDFFVPFYDREEKKLPEHVIGELIHQVTETAALNGAIYTNEALEKFIGELESIGEVGDQIEEELCVSVLTNSFPDEIFTLGNEEKIDKALVKESKKIRSSLKAESAWKLIQEVVIKGDMQKARQIALNAWKKEAGKKQRTCCYCAASRSAPRTSSRSRRSPVRSAAKAGDDGGGDGDSDGPGEPPKPSHKGRIILPAPIQARLIPFSCKTKRFPHSRTPHPCRWSMGWRWSA